MTNELLVNASRDYHWRGSGDQHTDYAGSLGLPNPLDGFNWPNFSGMGLGSYPFGTANPFWLITNYGLLQDNATKIHGKHEFQFGFHVRYELVDKSATPTAGRSTRTRSPLHSTTHVHRRPARSPGRRPASDSQISSSAS